MILDPMRAKVLLRTADEVEADVLKLEAEETAAGAARNDIDRPHDA